MRLTGGTLGGRRIAGPASRGVRPTPGRVKEALFSMLGSRTIGARFLDLYAGTGAIGFEALSRGASEVTFVEERPRVAKQIAVTAAALGFGRDRAHVVTARAERAVERLQGRYDLVFADPPYALGLPERIIRRLHERGLVDERSLVIYEHASRAEVGAPAGFAAERHAAYGEVALTFLRPEPVPS
ncbi:MAG TPA: 16S rRNA (guanine(966)-N(2))-methyltransferase RsmD [Candidatus Dormibacteraeota bacterium]|nr:16S rRNA (guanine(966)-N(2))-methyltransferase RsmD [Candidatus Dormibacteraeota bacterium]